MNGMRSWRHFQLLHTIQSTLLNDIRKGDEKKVVRNINWWRWEALERRENRKQHQMHGVFDEKEEKKKLIINWSYKIN